VEVIVAGKHVKSEGIVVVPPQPPNIFSIELQKEKRATLDQRRHREMENEPTSRRARIRAR
jgi:hypothetical protein